MFLYNPGSELPHVHRARVHRAKHEKSGGEVGSLVARREDYWGGDET